MASREGKESGNIFKQLGGISEMNWQLSLEMGG
jgi:hypothetical protein